MIKYVDILLEIMDSFWCIIVMHQYYDALAWCIINVMLYRNGAPTLHQPYQL